MVSRRAGIRLFLVLAFLAVASVATNPLWLPWLGYALIHDEGPQKAGIAVVPAGDQYGRRIEKAAELVKAGYVPGVLVSGPPAFGVHESDLAIAMMVRKGYPASWFCSLPNDALSTKEEAAAVLRELRRRGVASFLLVTSTYHTARAARIYREAERAAGGPSFRVVAAEDEYFRPGSWWRSRQGQKIVFIEWMKTIAEAVGK